MIKNQLKTMPYILIDHRDNFSSWTHYVLLDFYSILIQNSTALVLQVTNIGGYPCSHMAVNLGQIDFCSTELLNFREAGPSSSRNLRGDLPPEEACRGAVSLLPYLLLAHTP